MLLKLHKRSVICKQLVSYPRPITSTFFYEVGASSSLQWYFNKQESKFLHDNFLNEDLVWPGSYVFLDDPQIPEVILPLSSSSYIIIINNNNNNIFVNIITYHYSLGSFKVERNNTKYANLLQ